MVSIFASDSLFTYFSRFGQVVDCVVMKNSQTGKSRGFGFVKFSDPAVLDVVLMHAPHWIDGRQVCFTIVFKSLTDLTVNFFLG